MENIKEIINQVKEMRKAQTLYARNKDWQTLQIARTIEQRVDTMIEEVTTDKSVEAPVFDVDKWYKAPRSIQVCNPWETRRYEIAKAVIAGMSANESCRGLSTDYLIEQALAVTDKLIDKLKSTQHD